jgi:hypothetical protein
MTIITDGQQVIGLMHTAIAKPKSKQVSIIPTLGGY